MNNSGYTVTLLVDKTPQQVFEAINNVTAWWTENLEGSSNQLNDEFSVQFWDVHYSRHKLIEVIPGKKIVWLTTDSQLNFLEDKTEWNGTKVSFEITEQDGQTAVCFTHHGLTPQVECYKNCSNAWGGYINNSLYNLITTGKGMPTEKEG